MRKLILAGAASVALALTIAACEPEEACGVTVAPARPTIVSSPSTSAATSAATAAAIIAASAAAQDDEDAC